MKIVGNDFWWSQVRNIQEEMGSHYKDAEIECFYRLYKRMKDDQMLERDIMAHFQESFDIRYTAFYTRKRKAGLKHVL